ncbi:MAG: arsenate reductase ArsC [Thermoplasmata archaeon]
MPKKKVLVLCVHNSARSQMAEAFIRAIYGVDVYSAGSEPTYLHPLAVEVMKEVGIDISNQRAKHLSEFKGMKFDLVLTVCGHPDETGEKCPFFPGAKKYIHKSFEEPDRKELSDEEKLEKFRKVRDELREWVMELEHEFV